MAGRILATVLAVIACWTLPGLGEGKAPALSNNWAPPEIDESVPPADVSQACPLSSLLEQTSHQARKLLANLQQFSARETLEYAEIARNGLPQSTHTTVFTYVADIREVRPGQFTVDEYRNDGLGAQQFPSRLATTGTAAFALIFHPFYIGDFSITCEGLSQVGGHPAWQVHFVQRAGRSNNFRGYRVAEAFYPIQLKGRAWIAQDSHDVLRLETDLLHPVPQIKLLREHVAIEYGPVRFAQHDVTLWLPRESVIHMDYRGRRYFHRHSFTAHQLFSVDTEQAAKLPSGP